MAQPKIDMSAKEFVDRYCQPVLEAELREFELLYCVASEDEIYKAIALEKVRNERNSQS